MSTSGKKKMPIPSFRELKARGQKLTMITVYDYPFAQLVDRSEAELILVGDSLGMVIHPELIVDVGLKIGLKSDMLRCHKSQKNWLDVSQGQDSWAILIPTARR